MRTKKVTYAEITADKDSFFSVMERSGQILIVIETHQENMETVPDGVKEENGNSRASLQEKNPWPGADDPRAQLECESSYPGLNYRSRRKSRSSRIFYTNFQATVDD